MGRQLIVLILVLMVIIGAVIVSLSKKQVDATEEVSESTLRTSAHNLSNAFAEIALKELIFNLHHDIDDLPLYVNHDHSNYIPNSIVNVHVEKYHIDGDELDADDYLIISIVEITEGDYTYTAQTDVVFTFGTVIDPNVDLRDPDEEYDDPNDYPQATDGVLYASKASNVYHFPTCRYIKSIKKKNLITFEDEPEALSRNYRQCKVCHDLIVNPPVIDPIVPTVPEPHPAERIEGIRSWSERPVIKR
jgi:uncharacterized membrane-anchored protein YhcB (DUF1043 family)